MDSLRVRVYYDFASSLCYVAHRMMERMEGTLAELDIALEWRPLDLARITGWPRGARVEGPRRENALRVASELEVPLRMPAVWMDSRPANAAALALAGSAREATWRERVFSGVFEQGGSLDDAASWARELGLDLEVLAGEAQHRALEDETRDAAGREVCGVPTFMLGEWPFGGIQEEFTMRSILGRWAARQRR